ncbi:tyrosine-type recombinase/integrase [Micromonospora sp. NPDC047740]|uniref:tyrosine-type recombinase/integrase n=1 Tax=Micromonospora sp. NPDC047740 TaxID=3364254 RepID=UPI00371675A0
MERSPGPRHELRLPNRRGTRSHRPTGLRFHDLRHSYATWLVSDGVPINDVAKVMGHEQTSTTLNRYTHSTAERDRGC